MFILFYTTLISAAPIANWQSKAAERRDCNSELKSSVKHMIPVADHVANHVIPNLIPS